MKKLFLIILLIITGKISHAQFYLQPRQTLNVAITSTEEPVVQTALQIFSRDYQAVFSGRVLTDSLKGNIIVGTIGKSRLLENILVDNATLYEKKQGFMLKVLKDGRLLVVGNDSHGTAYGLMELSRLIGVSPWEWWADATPEKKTSFRLPTDYTDIQFPSVEYRGIFINDEDWGLMPWSSLIHEPWYKPGRIGPRTHERIFELLLRLRANTYWPAMHECTEPFFMTQGNREVARKYGIYIGSSHCEPMACSTPVEWKRRGKGDYDYVHNSKEVLHFWEQRVKETAGQEIFYTIGMRGVHDGQMQGAKTVEEQKKVTEHVLKDQRELLRKYVNPDITAVPQVFIPYKEVLDIYHAGLQVPEDVTLMWCDDNYGYIRHFPTSEERARKGGNGIYYHISYWGRPHDYLWLGTFSPALLYQQMKEAYERGIEKIWILNVGDIKPAEYQTELFMDMAWNIGKVEKEGISNHLCHFLQREFGEEIGKELLPIMQEHYRLAYIRKPEFMGHTREEEYHTNRYRIVTDMPWSRTFIQKRLEDYHNISDRVEKLTQQIPENRKDTYFQLVKYPVQAATEMNKKMLYAQFARHGEMDWSRSEAAYDSIVTLTRIYNTGYFNNSKWSRIMDHQPRRLPVFEPVKHSSVLEPILEECSPLYHWNAMDADKGTPIACENLGYEGRAAAIGKGTGLEFRFGSCPTDSIEIEVRLLPNHPVTDDGRLRFSIALDNCAPQVVSYHTKGRSEEWKENVLGNQAIKKIVLPISSKKKHKINIQALDEGVILDQILLYSISNL